MFNALQGLGYGVISFAVIIGVGTVVLARLGGSIADCDNIGTSVFAYNYTLEKCANQSNTAVGAYTPTSAGWVNTKYLWGQLGSTGLAGWTPAIIALTVGMLFIGAFLVGKGGKGSY